MGLRALIVGESHDENAHDELDSMYRGREMAAAENRTEIPNVRDIFKEMAEASRECDEMLEIYLWRRRSTVT